MHFSMGSWDCQCVVYQRYLPTVKPQGSFDTTWRRRRLGLEKLERVGLSCACGQHCLQPHLLGKVWGGPGVDANVLDKVQSSAPLSLMPLGENPSTMPESHDESDWSSFLSMHSGALPSDNNAEPSVSYHGGVMIHYQ
jgi:hypothetical protein